MSRIVKKPSSIFKTKQANRDMFQNDFYLMKVKLKIFNFSFFLTSREKQEI